jgi:translocation and assembly module TamA
MGIGGIVLRLLGCALPLLAAGCSDDAVFSAAERPETAIPDYEIVIEGAPDAETLDLAEDSLAVFRLEDEGAQSRAFLRRRAEGDIELVARILRSRGYMEGTATANLSPEGVEPPVVTITMVPGPVYTLAAHRFEIASQGPKAPPAPDPVALGSPVGRPVLAERVVAAEDAAVGLLRREGFAYATFTRREALADREAKTVTVVTEIAAGRAYRFGPLAFEGVTAVPEAYLRTYQTWVEGEAFDGARLRDFQRRLAATGLFLSVSAEPPAEPPQTETLPVLVLAEERRPRTIRGELRYDTIDGPQVAATLVHRNLWGRNEEGTIAAVVGLERQIVDLGIVVPQYGRDGQRLLSSLQLRHVTEPAYDELGATLTLGLERTLTETVDAGFGGLLEASRIEDQGVESDVALAGLPLFVAEDTTDDFLDPSEGHRLRLELTPFAGTSNGDPIAFTVIDGRGSTYWALTEDRGTVLAVRARLAGILADSLADVPATRRLYSGGGGSVRGYGKDLIGPLDAKGDPTGGLSAVEAGAELRRRLWGDFGGALFLEAGAVSDDTVPDFSAGVQVAAGIGLRYWSPVGPIRADVAFPLNPRDSDDPFQFYVSIGQAF